MASFPLRLPQQQIMEQHGHHTHASSHSIMPSYLLCHGAAADSAVPEDASMETSSVVLDTSSPQRTANSVDKKRTKPSGEEGASLGSAHHSKDSKKEGGTKKRGGKRERNSKEVDEAPKGYIHVRARRGQATDSHSLAERVRRERISERMRVLQALVPGCDKVTGKALVLDEIINYVQSLQNQVEFLSMRIASLSPVLYGFGMDSDALFSDHTHQKMEGIMLNYEALAMPAASASALNRAPAPPQAALMDTTTNTSTSSASYEYEAHGDGGGVSFHQDNGSSYMVQTVGDEPREELFSQQGVFGNNMCAFQ